MELEIVYRDTHLIAINKPHGLLVHRTPLARDATEFALQMLRDQIGQTVHPVHRIDRKTGGLLLFALDMDTLKAMQQKFAAATLKKEYISIVRGFTEDQGHIDYDLKNENGKLQTAITNYTTLARTEIPVPFGKYSTSRYSVVKVQPITGRTHQIRKHLAHILHPIIADRPHGCNKQNKLFKDKWNMTTMLLHSKSLSFKHPVTEKPITIHSPFQADFLAAAALLKVEKTIIKEGTL